MRPIAALPRPRSGGFAYVLALLLLLVFSSLSVAMLSTTTLSQTQAQNSTAVMQARVAAESGLSYMVYQLTHTSVSGSLRGQMLFATIKARLQAALNGTPNANGATVTATASTISVPSISLDSATSFAATVTVPTYDTVHIAVTGSYSQGTGGTKTTVRRTIGMDLQATGNAAFGFGVWCKGPITMGMNMDFDGLYFALDGSMYSASGGVAVATGSGHISGDISVSDPHATVSLGRTTIDGEVFYDAPIITAPTISRAPYIALATNTLGAARTGTLKNVRIPAGTNPTFGDVTIQGVLYIESPNVVTFGNNVNMTGVIVAADQAAGSTDAANWISFKNNMTMHGVEDLPATSEFAAIRQMIGTCVLAPGFTMEFKNNLDSAAGVIAVKALEAKNNLVTMLYGSILIYGSGGLTFKNNSDITVDHSRYPNSPAGFTGVGSPILTPLSATYAEN
ncbi:MAG: hypothetical protein NT031_11560 [Planctomycetota bacterium]|nr:hypothetical protein [Planctomycetota bacterium]